MQAEPLEASRKQIGDPQAALDEQAMVAVTVPQRKIIRASYQSGMISKPSHRESPS